MTSATWCGPCWGEIPTLNKLAKKYDGEISAFYLTLGQYDLFLICKFPNNEKVAQFSLKLSSLGNVRTNTLKAFTEDEFKQLLES